MIITKGIGHANGTQEEAFESSGGEKVPQLLKVQIAFLGASLSPYK